MSASRCKYSIAIAIFYATWAYYYANRSSCCKSRPRKNKYRAGERAHRASAV